MKAWRALGIPETAAFKMDDEQGTSTLQRMRERQSSDDVDSLMRQGWQTQRSGFLPANGTGELRKRYWESEDSPLTLRLQQLTTASGKNFLTSDGESFLKPQDLDIRKVTLYSEPVYPTFRMLQEFSQIERRDSAWSKVKSAQGFDFLTWEKGVRVAMDDGLVQYGTVDGQSFVNIDPDKLSALLVQSDKYGPLTAEQRKVLDRRLAEDVEQATRWAAQVNLMSISQADKERALAQLVENLAANHLANSMLFEYATVNGWKGPTLSRVPALDAQKNIDDFYTLTQLVRGRWTL
jgi:hypothetical protein